MMSDIKCTCYKGGFGDVCEKCRARELKQETPDQIITDNSQVFINQAKQIEELEEQLADLPQLFSEDEVAKIKAEAIREFISHIKGMSDEDQKLKGRFQAELFWKGAFAVHEFGIDYAKQLEGGE